MPRCQARRLEIVSCSRRCTRHRASRRRRPATARPRRPAPRAARHPSSQSDRRDAGTLAVTRIWPSVTVTSRRPLRSRRTLKAVPTARIRRPPAESRRMAGRGRAAPRSAPRPARSAMLALPRAERDFHARGRVQLHDRPVRQRLGALLADGGLARPGCAPAAAATAGAAATVRLRVRLRPHGGRRPRAQRPVRGQQQHGRPRAPPARRRRRATMRRATRPRRRRRAHRATPPGRTARASGPSRPTARPSRPAPARAADPRRPRPAAPARVASGSRPRSMRLSQMLASSSTRRRLLNCSSLAMVALRPRRAAALAPPRVRRGRSSNAGCPWRRASRPCSR
jgi:hypothetical protein